MRYNVRDQIGINAITIDDGQIIYDIVYSALMNQEQIELDFEGVEIVASPFLNVAIGKLMRDFTPDQLNTYLKFKNVSSITLPILRRVIETSRKYYTEEKYRLAVNSVVEEEASEDYGI
jgi:glutaredoxin-related protein